MIGLVTLCRRSDQHLKGQRVQEKVEGQVGCKVVKTFLLSRMFSVALRDALEHTFLQNSKSFSTELPIFSLLENSKSNLSFCMFYWKYKNNKFALN